MVKKLQCLFRKQWSELISKKFFILLLFQVLGISSFSQQLFVNTSIDNGIHNYVFYDGITDSTKITVVATDPFYSGGPYEFREYDHSLNMIKRKRFQVVNPQACGTGYSSMHVNVMKFYPRLTDSSIYATTNFTHNYGSCPQQNGFVIMKMTSNFDFIWTRQYKSLSKGSIPYNDSTLLIYGGSNIFSVKIGNGDINWARYSSGYMSIEGAIEGFTDTTVFVYGRGFSANPPTNCSSIFELSSSGNYIWCAALCDTTISQYFTHGIRSADSSFVLLSIRDHNTLTAHIGLTKINKWGNKIWEKVYTLSGYFEGPSGLIQTADGGYLITYTAYSSPVIDYPLLMKTDSLGDVEWNRIFPGTNYACQFTTLGKIKTLGDEKLLILGGNLIQTDTYGDQCLFNPFVNVNVSNGNSILLLQTTSTTQMPLQAYPEILNNSYIDQIGSETANIDSCFNITELSESPTQIPFQFLPNPSSDKILIQIPGNKMELKISVFNLLGTLVFNSKTFNDEMIISIDETGSGVFIVKAERENQTCFSKIVFNR